MLEDSEEEEEGVGPHLIEPAVAEEAAAGPPSSLPSDNVADTAPFTIRKKNILRESLPHKKPGYSHATAPFLNPLGADAQAGMLPVSPPADPSPPGEVFSGWSVLVSMNPCVTITPAALLTCSHLRIDNDAKVTP